MSNIDTIAYARAGQIFVASNVSAKIVTVVGTAMTGLILMNPTGSGKYLAFLSAQYSMTTTPVAEITICLAVTEVQPVIPSSITAGSAVVNNANGGEGQGVATAGDIVTLGVAPVARRWFAGMSFGTDVASTPYTMNDKIDGELGLLPGSAAAFAFIGSAPTGMGSITYVEIDL